MYDNKTIRKKFIQNMSTDRVILCIVNIINNTFSKNVIVLLDERYYVLAVSNEKIAIKKKTIDKLKTQEAYAVDRYILNLLENAGVFLGKSKCLYLKHCYE